jgi:hypothetical protein
MHRTLRLLSTVLTIAVVTLGLTAAPALAAPEGQFVSKINATRAANGLEPLEVYWDLADDAEAHSKTMMAQDDLHHNPNLAGVTSGWSALAENVGVGPDVARLHTAFMESDGHRRNILGNYNYVGVGVVRESDTKIWVTVVFMQGPDGLVSPPDAPPADDPPAEEPPDPAPVPDPDPLPPAPKAEGTSPARSPEPAFAPAPEPEPLVRFGHPSKRQYAL